MHSGGVSFGSGKRVWVCWPAAVCHAGQPDDAYEAAVALDRCQSGAESNAVCGVLAAMLAAALTPRKGWSDVRDIAVEFSKRRGGRIAALLQEALDLAETAASDEEWQAAVTARDFRGRTSDIKLEWLYDFYSAVSALEYCFDGNRSWEDLARLAILGSDMRYASMIALSLRAALEGESGFPAVWLERLDGIFSTGLAKWTAGSYRTLSKKIDFEISNARDILGRTVALRDKIFAVMTTAALANVMGSPVEDRDYPWIVEKYGVVDTILEPGRLEGEDDSAMAAMWTDTYLKRRGRIFTEDLAESFRASMNPLKFYYDSQNAFARMMQGIPPHACGHRNIVTGSALMGCYPCGIYHAGDPDAAARDGLELAYHYQRGFDAHAAAILCAAAAAALAPGATVESVIEAAIRAAPKTPQQHHSRRRPRDARTHLRAALDAVEGCPDVLAARPILYEKFLEYNGQDPWEVVTLTMAIFKVSRGDVRQCMIGGTNIGRDSDTISSQTALLAAALSGSAAIPQDLLAFLPQKAIDNFRAKTDAMLDLIGEKSVRSLEIASIFTGEDRE